MVDVMDEKIYDLLIAIFDNMMTFRDPYNHHGPKVQKYAVKLARATNEFSEEEILKLRRAAALHDWGKLYLEPNLVNAPRRLVKLEMAQLQSHVHVGVSFFETLSDFDKDILEGIWTHHEDYNGLGYPRRLKGKDIHRYGRIIRITDVYDAMTSDRTYRVAIPKRNVLLYIKEMGGFLFDPEYANLFVEIMEKEDDTTTES